MKTNFKIYDDGRNGSLICFEFDILAETQKIMVFVKVKIPESEKDENYRRELINTRIDMEKLFNGIQGNYLTRIAFENLMTSIDFEPTFPLKKVKID